MTPSEIYLSQLILFYFVGMSISTAILEYLIIRSGILRIEKTGE